MKKFKKKINKTLKKTIRFTKGNEFTIALSLGFIAISIVTLTVF